MFQFSRLRKLSVSGRLKSGVRHETESFEEAADVMEYERIVYFKLSRDRKGALKLGHPRDLPNHVRLL